MPSQRQLKWAQLRVGLTVVFASIMLAILIFLMSGSVGLFSGKLHLFAYFENAGGLRVGAPVRLEGVDIGSVDRIRLVPPKEQPPPSVSTSPSQVPSDIPLDKPVEVTLTIGKRYLFDLRTDSIAALNTAGVLGETFIDIDSTGATGPVVANHAILRTRRTKTLEGAISASQSTIENVDVLVRRLDRILRTVESGQGSVGRFLTDEELYNRLNATLNRVQSLVDQVASGRGSLGQLLYSDDLYNKLNASVDKVNSVLAEIDTGSGTVPKLIHDPGLYNQANDVIVKANRLMDDLNSGKGALGKAINDPVTARKLEDSLTKLNTIMDRLAAGQGSVGQALVNDSLYTSADQALVETRNLIKAIREDPKRYLTIHFRVF